MKKPFLLSISLSCMDDNKTRCAMKRVILFDGECNFCHWNVQFIIKRDPKGRFLFASLQSEQGQALLQRHAIDTNEDSIILFENNRLYMQSTAVLKIAKQLYRLYPLLYVFIIIPRPLRNIFYRFVANNRYKWFGKKDKCMIPTEEEKKRFLS